MTERTPNRYASPEEAKEARRIYMREYLKQNAHKYRDKQNQKAKERYHSDAEYRARCIAAGVARYAANPEPTKERTRRNYPLVKAKVAERVETMKRMYGLLPEHQRAEYTEWLLLLSSGDSYMQLAIRTPSFDYSYIARYSDI